MKPSKFKNQKQEKPGIESEMTPKPEYISKKYKASGKLKNKIAVITGGDSGIGRSIAVHYAHEGADIAIIYLSENKDAKETKKLVEAQNRKCLLLKGDITDEKFCKKCIDDVLKEYGHMNIIINNAGTHFNADTPTEVTTENLKKTFETNIYPLFYFVKAALPHLKKGDTIINTSSVTANRGSDHLLDYSSTKGAISTFTKSLATMLAKKGIRVNGVAPGPIWTPLIVSSFDDLEKFGKDTPMGRAGQPSEVGPAYVFLASQDSSYITGQMIHVNGGEIVGS
ncbi:MAG: family oxidoreductase [Fluviicola sp.]|jgi:NAD(P)-dependent dehydrogenase (short-subunit alcohol dehydrogenase family)|uniref:SDR family oxidoreductase n=1 Tax=Fluviicola sp. TaxID=1917219 RepID=UPI0026092E0D|nr:SDR family oxidoreductase [Fluviicola sp.]MDF3026675.1 family oxidoreductase [Fluviicola sp.]